MPSYTITENSTAQNSSDTPSTGVEEVSLAESSPTLNQDAFGGFESSRFGSGDHQNAIIRFDTSVIPAGETVTAATLFMYHTANNGEGHTIDAYEVLQTGWGETTATWNTYDGSTAWNTGGCRGSGTDRASSADDSATFTATTSEYKSFTIATATINKSGNTEFLIEMNPGDGESGDFWVWADSEDSDGTRPELVVTTSAGAAEVVVIGSGLLNSLKLRAMRLIG